MGTFTQSLFIKQKKLDWFSNLTDYNRFTLTQVFKKDLDNLLNEDVIEMYDKYHKCIELRDKLNNVK